MKTKIVYTFFRSINLWRHPWNKCRPKTTKSQLIRKTKSATGAKGGKKGTGKHVTTGLGFVFDWLKKYLCSDWLEHCMSLINTNAKFMPNHERPSIWFVQTKQLCGTGDLPYLFCWQFKEVYGFCFVLLNPMTLLIKKNTQKHPNHRATKSATSPVQLIAGWLAGNTWNVGSSSYVNTS